MAIALMAFTPATGFSDATTYPDPATEAAARAQLQTSPNQLRDYINATLISAIENVSIVDITASKTLALTDAYTLQICTHTTVAIALTVPPNTSVAFPVGTQIAVKQGGVAAVSVVAGSGVTINPSTKLKVNAQYESACLVKEATDIWGWIGSVKA